MNQRDGALTLTTASTGSVGVRPVVLGDPAACRSATAPPIEKPTVATRR